MDNLRKPSLDSDDCDPAEESDPGYFCDPEKGNFYIRPCLTMDKQERVACRTARFRKGRPVGIVIGSVKEALRNMVETLLIK